MTLDFSDLNLSREDIREQKEKNAFKIKTTFKNTTEDQNIILMHNDLETLQIFQSLIAKAKSKKDIVLELGLPTTSAYRKFNALEKMGLIIRVGKKQQEKIEYLYLSKYTKTSVNFSAKGITVCAKLREVANS